MLTLLGADASIADHAAPRIVAIALVARDRVDVQVGPVCQVAAPVGPVVK